MAHDIGRREMIRKGLPAAGAAALLATPLTAGRAAAEQTGDPRTHPIVGTWMAQVTIVGSDFPPEEGMFSYGGDGLMSGTDVSRVTGFGTWRPTGARTFTLEYRHYVVTNDQAAGIVVVTMTGTVTSSTAFTESGEAKFIDPNGNVVLTHEANAVGTRFGFAPAHT
jgi:hypothetical protein